MVFRFGVILKFKFLLYQSMFILFLLYSCIADDRWKIDEYHNNLLELFYKELQQYSGVAQNTSM